MDCGIRFPFVVISNAPWAVTAADVARVFVLIVAFMLCASMLWEARHTAGTLHRLRHTMIALFLISVAGTEYSRLGEAVSTRLPLNLTALVLAAVTFRLATRETGRRSPTALDAPPEEGQR